MADTLQRLRSRLKIPPVRTVIHVVVTEAVVNLCWAAVSQWIVNNGTVRDWGFLVLSSLALVGVFWFLANTQQRGITILQDGRPIPKTRQEKIDADDRRALTDRLIILSADADFRYLAAVEPYVDFTFVVFNGSTFTIAFHDKVEGRLVCLGQELKESLKMLEPKPDGVLAHGQRIQIRLRQWLSLEIAAAIKKYPPGSQVEVGFDNVAILFEPVDDPLPLPSDRPRRLLLSTQVFEMRF
jgi:hypothetical protein